MATLEESVVQAFVEEHRKWRAEALKKLKEAKEFIEQNNFAEKIAEILKE